MAVAALRSASHRAQPVSDMRTGTPAIAASTAAIPHPHAATRGRTPTDAREPRRRIAGPTKSTQPERPDPRAPAAARPGPSPTRTSLADGSDARRIAIASTRISIRFTGTRRPTETTSPGSDAVRSPRNADPRRSARDMRIRRRRGALIRQGSTGSRSGPHPRGGPETTPTGGATATSVRPRRHRRKPAMVLDFERHADQPRRGPPTTPSSNGSCAVTRSAPEARRRSARQARKRRMGNDRETAATTSSPAPTTPSLPAPSRRPGRLRRAKPAIAPQSRNPRKAGGIPLNITMRMWRGSQESLSFFCEDRGAAAGRRGHGRAKTSVHDAASSIGRTSHIPEIAPSSRDSRRGRSRGTAVRTRPLRRRRAEAFIRRRQRHDVRGQVPFGNRLPVDASQETHAVGKTWTRRAPSIPRAPARPQRTRADGPRRCSERTDQQIPVLPRDGAYHRENHGLPSTPNFPRSASRPADGAGNGSMPAYTVRIRSDGAPQRSGDARRGSGSARRSGRRAARPSAPCAPRS